jgi:hypothetical protein
MSSKSKKSLPRKPPSQRGNRARCQSAQSHNPHGVRYLAMHEAGHAVAAIVLGIKLVRASIENTRLPSGILLQGFTETDGPRPEDIREGGEAVAMPLMVQLFAGPMAEIRLHDELGTSFPKGIDSHDQRNIWAFAMLAVCECTAKDGDQVITEEEKLRKKPLIDELYKKAGESAIQLVRSHLDEIKAVADSLIAKRTLTGDEVTSIIRASIADPG